MAMTARDAERWVGRSLFDDAVPTPFLFVDRTILERNIAHMQALANAFSVGLRPHTKTHKIAAIAKMQLQAGACGLTVAKLGEAQALIDAGIRTSFMVAQPFVGAEKVRWALRLAEQNELLVCLDSLELAASLGEVAIALGKALDIVLIVDTGYQRFGVDWREAPAVAEQMARLKGIRFRGIRSHDGRTYRMPTLPERQQVAREEAERMAETAHLIRRLGVPCELVSIGSTPGAYFVLQNGWTDGITELRPGNYVFHDRMQISLGVARPDDCALRVVASVVSLPRKGEALMDAGLKTLTGTQDRFAEGYGLVINRPDAVVEKLWEECGLVRFADVPPKIGDRLVIIPNHACELTNLAEVVFYGSGDRIEGFWIAEGRGKVW
jgi:D-serine deaminase-like pyridoxal phosphate-dependent protein